MIGPVIWDGLFELLVGLAWACWRLTGEGD